MNLISDATITRLQSKVAWLPSSSASETLLRGIVPFRQGRLWAGSDHDRRMDDQLTSTSHQPANACLAPGLLPKVSGYCPLLRWIMRQIKGLAHK